MTCIVQTAGAVAVGSGAVLGIVAVCIMALLMTAAMLWAGNSMKRLMPVVVTIWVIAGVLNAWNLYLRCKGNNAEQQQRQQTTPQTSQTNLQSSPIESSGSGHAGQPHQATALQLWMMLPVASLDTFRESNRLDSCQQVASDAHQVRSDLPCDVTMPNESSSPTAGGGSGGAQPKDTNEK